MNKLLRSRFANKAKTRKIITITAALHKARGIAQICWAREPAPAAHNALITGAARIRASIRWGVAKVERITVLRPLGDIADHVFNAKFIGR